jgi:hypothetical protein
MKRNLKALGLAMVAALALSAVAVSGAQAVENHHLTVQTAPAIITAEDHVNNRFVITGGEHEVECTTAKYKGTVPDATSTEVTVTPEYSGCKVDPPFGPSATVDVNHCAYILTGDTNANGHAPVHVECSGEPQSEITITYSLFGSSCVVHVPAQTPTGGGVHYTQTVNPTTNKKDVTVNVTVEGIHYKETGSGFCPATHEGIDGTLNGAVTAQAYLDNGSAQTGTEKTTPTFNEGAVQDLELTTT